MKTDREIRRTIREMRESLHLSQEQIARNIGIATTTYANVEKGPTEIIYKHLPDIAAELGTSVEMLLLGYEPCDPGESELRSEADYNERIRAVIDDYEDRLSENRRIIGEKEALIQDMTETVKSLRDTVSYLISQKK